MSHAASPDDNAPNYLSTAPPDWVKHAVFYQIFPDRFARSPHAALPGGIQFKPWGAPPEEQGFQGGDLLGVVDKLDYLLELGVNALYLNPVFSSAANHRYHTFDYMTVDPLLGGDGALRELLDAAHANGIRVVLDGVFNHASRGFWPFHHVLETGGNSPYLDWFYIHDWPLIPYPPDGNTPHNYEAWWGLPALPKLNVENPGMRAYLLEAARYWIEFGADGWRLDVPDEIEDGPFWQEFRRVVKEANPDAYLVGEIWDEAQEWLQGDRFDAVMNYVFSRAAYGFFGAKTVRTNYRPGGFDLVALDAPAFAAAVDEMCALYDWPIVQAQLNLMNSHDTARALWIVDDDESAVRLCVLFQMTMPGAPCIYYGDEIGMTGGTDPYCRAAFPWHEPDSWNEELLDFYRRAVALRHDHAILRTGGVQTVYAQDGCYGFLRAPVSQAARVTVARGDTVPSRDDAKEASAESGAGYALVVFNTNEDSARITLKDLPPALHNRPLANAWNEGEYVTDRGRLADILIPPRDAVVLVSRQQ